jgi:hypothetical protein
MEEFHQWIVASVTTVMHLSRNDADGMKQRGFCLNLPRQFNGRIIAVDCSLSNYFNAPVMIHVRLAILYLYGSLET